MSEADIGIIGGSGLYQMDELTDVSEKKLDTPYGPPSDAIVLGTLKGRRVAFLPRHGRGHRINPTQVPYRANIYALKTLGVERVLSINAVGSLREEIAPMDIVIPDQVIDRTRHRSDTFFENGIVAHIAFAEPFCPELRKLAAAAAESTGARVHVDGIYIAMEGPQFSTRAESELYRSWGAHLIGMTVFPEAKLAREAEMCYTSVAFVTDYDCWHPGHDSVTTEIILTCLRKGTETAHTLVRSVVEALPPSRSCACGTALNNAIVTAPDLIPSEVKKRLRPIAGRYLQDD